VGKTDISLIKKIREETQASIAEIKICLEEAGGDVDLARKLLRKKGFEKVEKKKGRETKAGIVESYLHISTPDMPPTSGAMVVLAAETDFVTKNNEFRNLAHEIAMQICATAPKNLQELLRQPYIRDESRTVSDLIAEKIAKFGENIEIKDFKRFSL